MYHFHIPLKVFLHQIQPHISEYQEPHLRPNNNHGVVELALLDVAIKPLHLQVVIQLLCDVSRQDVC